MLRITCSHEPYDFRALSQCAQPHPTLGKFEGHAVYVVLFWLGPFIHKAACLRRYAIKKVQVLAMSAKMIVQDCVEASENIDARDKFFMYFALTDGRLMQT